MRRDVSSRTEDQAAAHQRMFGEPWSRLAAAEERGYDAPRGDELPASDDACVLGDCGRDGCLVDAMFAVLERRRDEERDREWWS